MVAFSTFSDVGEMLLRIVSIALLNDRSDFGVARPRPSAGWPKTSGTCK